MKKRLILLRREASKLRGIGSSCGFPLVNLIAHRLETYLSGNLTRLNERQIEDVTKFADRLAVAVDREERPDVATTNQIIRTLPVRYEFDITDIEVHDVEIMLVTPSKVVSKLVSTELGACGFPYRRGSRSDRVHSARRPHAARHDHRVRGNGWAGRYGSAARPEGHDADP